MRPATRAFVPNVSQRSFVSAIGALQRTRGGQEGGPHECPPVHCRIFTRVYWIRRFGELPGASAVGLSGCYPQGRRRPDDHLRTAGVGNHKIEVSDDGKTSICDGSAGWSHCVTAHRRNVRGGLDSVRRADTRDNALVCGHEGYPARWRDVVGVLFLRIGRAASDCLGGAESFPLVLSTNEDLPSPRQRRERRLADDDGRPDVPGSCLAADSVLRTTWHRHVLRNRRRIMFKTMRKQELRINRVRQELVTAAWSSICLCPVVFRLVPLYSDCTTSSHDGLTMPPNVDRSSQSHDFIDLFENGALELHFVGPDGIILNANQAELDFLGYSQDEYIGHHIAEFHVDAPVIEDILARLSRKEILKNYEARLRAKDGSIKHVLITSNVLWEHDTFIHTRCFTRDITDRKRVEEERERLICQLQQTKETLEEKVQELEDFHDAVVDRELKMIELEKEVEQLRADNARLQATLLQRKHSG
jgi:PAS domain S-box-containing protein